MKRFIACSTFTQNTSSVDREFIERCAARANSKYEETGDAKYTSIAEQLEDALELDNETFKPSDFSALVKRFIDFCIDPDSDTAGHFTETEDDDDYFPKNITVYAISDPLEAELVTSKDFENGQEGLAVNEWFKLSSTYPTCTAISGKKHQGDAIHKWVLDNEDRVREWDKKYDCPYEIDWVIEQCKKPCNQSDKYPDQIYPFSLG